VIKDANDIVYLVCGLLVLYSIHLFLKVFFEPKDASILQILVLSFFFVVDYVLMKTVTITYLFPIFSFLLYFIVSLAYSKRLGLKNVWFAFIALVFGICSELIASYSVSIAFQNNLLVHEENAFPVALIVARFVFFLLFLLAIRFGRLKDRNKNKYFQPFIMIILPILSIVLVLYVFSLAEFRSDSILDSGSFGAFCSVLVIIVMNLVVFWMFDRQARLNQIEQDAYFLKETVRIQQEQYNEEKNRQDIIRRIKHDYKNYLISLKADLLSNHYDEAIGSIERKLDEEAFHSLTQSGWFPLDAVIAYKNATAVKKGISIIPQFALEGFPQISSEDVCVTVGNALDNGIEYLTVNKNCSREIKIRAAYKKGVLHFQLTNEVCEPIEIRNGNHIVSTKKEGDHGYGLKSMQLIVEKYGGELLLTCDANEFMCDILMYCKQDALL